MEMFCVNVSVLNISTRFNPLIKDGDDDIRLVETGAYLLLPEDRER